MHFDIDALRVDFERDQIVPHCACGGWVKTATVSFGQSMPIDQMLRAKRETLLADLFIAIGSSLVVYPAAGFPELAKRNGSTLVIVNLQKTGLDEMADLVVNKPIGDTLGSAVGID
jgi:NAD-dependent deacetylase